ncbi:MAG: Asd/ArgC dimerization domain-containing protein, partial [Agathobacter rectalis]
PTAESAALTNDDLQIIELDENDTFTGDDEMVNVCIATRKDDTALRDKIQDAMNAIGWNDKAKMDELMDQTKDLMAFRDVKAEVYPYQIAFNLLPHIGSFNDREIKVR